MRLPPVAVLLALACLGALAVDAWALDIPIPNGAATEGAAAGNFDVPMVSQQLFRAADFGLKPGDEVTGISLRLNGSVGSFTGVSFSRFDISIGPALGGLNSTFASNFAAAPVLTRSGNLSFIAADFPTTGTPHGWGKRINFSNTYTYLGGDLLVEVRSSASAPSMSIDAFQNPPDATTGQSHANLGDSDALTRNTGPFNSNWAMRLTVNRPLSNVLVNPGFEDGDFTGWTATSCCPSNQPLFVDDALPHGGGYSAHFNTEVSPGGTVSMNLSQSFSPVATSDVGELSFWGYKSIATGNLGQLIAHYTDHTTTALSLDVSSAGTWAKIDATFMLSAGKSLESLEIQRSVPNGVLEDVLYDDFILDVAIPLPPPACRWATAVVGFSSQFGPGGWSAQQALGPPNTYPTYGDLSTAWASLNPDAGREYLHLAFTPPAPINFVNVFETFAPGALDTIYVKNPSTGLFQVVWTDSAAPAPFASRVLTATFPQTAFNVTEIRLAFASQLVTNFNEVDAVAAGLCDMTAQSHWASSVVGFSSQLSPGNSSAAQALGVPNTYPAYGHSATTWSSATADGQREFLELAFTPPAAINFMRIAETLAPGAVDKVSVRNPNTGLYEVVWIDPAVTAPATSRIFTVSFPETRYLVSQARIDLNSPAVPGFNEIDAVAVGRCGCQATLVDVPDPVVVPASVVSLSARPNPFHGDADVSFALARAGRVSVDVFDVEGKRVVRLMERNLAPGTHQVRWDGHDHGGKSVASGVYFISLKADGVQTTRRIVRVW